MCCGPRVDCREEGSALLAAGPSPPGTQDDLMLAQMLQLEYDREHDLRLRAEEKHFNKHSKGTFYKIVPLPVFVHLHAKIPLLASATFAHDNIPPVISRIVGYFLQ